MNRIQAGDALIGLAVVALLLAALLPSYRARAFDRTVEAAVSDVETLRTGAAQARNLNGRWPDATPAGLAPPGVSGAFPGDSALVRDGYTLEWRLWNRVENAPAPPRPAAPPVLDEDEQPPPTGGGRPGDAPPDSAAVEMIKVVRPGGAVVVHSGRALLLAELLRRYGSDVSFVRDTTWTLLLNGAAGN